MAANAGCTTGYISELERGLKTPSTEFLYRLATALDLKVSELLRGTDGLPEKEDRRETLLKHLLALLEKAVELAKQAIKA